METSHLIHGNPVPLDVAKVVHLPALTELHRQDPRRGEVPVDLGGLPISRGGGRMNTQEG